MTDTKYTIVLQAKISPESMKLVQEQIAQLQRKIDSGTMGGGGGRTGGGSSKTIDPAKIAEGTKKMNDTLADWTRTATSANELDIKRNVLTNQAISATFKHSGALGEQITEQIRLNEKTGDFKQTIDTATGGISKASEATRNWTNNIINNAKKVVQWALATAMIYGTLKKLQEGVQYVTELNAALIDARIVTGMTESQVGELGREYNRLAKELGATTLQVADASLEFLRQGKTVEETQKLVTMSVMMSKLANMDAASSTEALTAIMNGFQLQVSDLMPVLDSLIKLDNAYATSTEEISQAMQRSASAASLSGVSWQELASYITIVSATTRKSAESIGESFGNF